MEAVLLKGRADGFEIQLVDSAAFSDVEEQLDKLLTRMHNDAPSGNVNFLVKTGRRLLSEEQRKHVETIFDQFPLFSVRSLASDVVAADLVAKRVASAKTHFAGGIVRSGQVLSYNGDVVFAGTLHRGATVKATGSIFVLGDAQGIVHAGYPENAYAFVAGNLGRLAQVRIADAVEIVEDGMFTGEAACYMNDQHLLAQAEMAELNKIRPQFFDIMEDK